MKTDFFCKKNWRIEQVCSQKLHSILKVICHFRVLNNNHWLGTQMRYLGLRQWKKYKKNLIFFLFLLFVFLVVLFFSHWLCSFCVVFLPWLFSCYSFRIGCVVFTLVLLFVAHWCCCLTVLVMLFIVHQCSCASMLVPLLSYVCALALLASILLCLSCKCCCLSHIGVVNLVAQVVLPFPHCVVNLVALGLLFLSHQCCHFFHISASCSRTYQFNLYFCSSYVGVDFVSLVSLVSPPSRPM